MQPSPNNNISTNRQAALRAKSSGNGRITLFVMLLVWLGLLGLLFANRQGISDWWQLRGYQPPAGISQLAAQDTMTDYAKHMLYLNKPQLLPSVASFRASCPENKDIVVLGCYHPVENGIYIYNVTDPELRGVVQVTAAHETLHAIYSRLNAKDKAYVNGLLNDYYKNGLTDKRVKNEIKQYQQTEPGAVLDEMHSTFGTEVADLPPALEKYYQNYFTRRSAVVAYDRQYESKFASRQSIVARDDRQLASLKAQIDSLETELNAQLEQLNVQQARLKDLKDSGQTGAYNAAVPGYNAQVDSYNQGVASLKSQISQYNQLVIARNLIAGQINTLNKALDTRLTPQTVQ